MQFQSYSFGSISIDGIIYEKDIVIDRGEIRKREKKSLKKSGGDFGHTPLSIEEDIPWKCQTLVIGTGMNGALPVMDGVKKEAKSRNVELIILPTTEAIEKLKRNPEKTNAILHLTC